MRVFFPVCEREALAVCEREALAVCESFFPVCESSSATKHKRCPESLKIYPNQSTSRTRKMPGIVEVS